MCFSNSTFYTLGNRKKTGEIETHGVLATRQPIRPRNTWWPKLEIWGRYLSSRTASQASRVMLDDSTTRDTP